MLPLVCSYGFDCNQRYRIIRRNKMSPIYLLGAHHGDYQTLFAKLHEREIRDATLIHVGDGEEGYPDWKVSDAEDLDRCFASFGIEYLSIRGDCSNPSLFDGSIMLPHFKLLPDYSRLSINGQSWFFAGGAFNLNSANRIQDQTYGPEEVYFIFKGERPEPADVLVTHSGPPWIGPKPRNLLAKANLPTEHAKVGEFCLRSQLEAERKCLEWLYRALSPKTWYLGHFDESTEKNYVGCRTRILDRFELIQHPTDPLPQETV